MHSRVTPIRRNMALNVKFKPGTKQSLIAANYFNGSAEEAVTGVIAGLAPRQYRIVLQDDASIDLRIRSENEFEPDELHGLIEWLRELHQDIRVLNEPVLDQSDFERVALNWLAKRDTMLTFFLEQLADDPEDTGLEPNLSLGVLGGRTIMISTDTVMFTQLAPGVHGLSIAQRGSYLLEDDAAMGRLRRA
ncbi:MAG: hypothetical protein IPH63_02505 [Flavobacteriales bacterium]|nr:hypothetical protein [Flavobacteriales bacterium]